MTSHRVYVDKLKYNKTFILLSTVQCETTFTKRTLVIIEMKLIDIFHFSRHCSHLFPDLYRRNLTELDHHAI